MLCGDAHFEMVRSEQKMAIKITKNTCYTLATGHFLQTISGSSTGFLNAYKLFWMKCLVDDRRHRFI